MKAIESSDPNSEMTFENCFERLEHILEKMNSGTISLDESLRLYEEADRLISICNRRLSDAERRVEILIKNRNNELTLGNDQKPLTQDFSLNSPQNSNLRANQKDPS